jgi:hypothetical protein
MGLVPTLHFDYDRSEQLIGLTRSNQQDLNENLLSLASEGHSDYRITNSYFIEAGAGLDSFTLGPSIFGNSTGLATGTWNYIGVLPVFKKKLTVTRYISNGDDLSYFKMKGKLPSSIEYLDQLNPGDTVRYFTSGGLVFNIGTAASILGVGAQAMAKGEFLYTLEKVSDGQVFIKVSESKIRSFAFQKGSYLVSAKKALFSKYSSGLGFFINYQNPVGEKAFYSLISGNIAPVQKLAFSEASVQLRLTSRHFQRGVNRSFFIGLPFFLNYGRDRANYLQYSQENFLNCRQMVKAKYSVYHDSKFSTFGRASKEEDRIFYTSFYQTFKTSEAFPYRREKLIDSGVFGEFIWNMSSYQTSRKTLKKAFKKLSKQTGLRHITSLKIPYQRDLGDINVKLKISFSNDHSNSLVKAVTSRSEKEILLSARTYVWKYFKNGDPDQVCRNLRWSESDPGHVEDLSGDLADCKSKFRYRVESIARDMIGQLKKMKYHRDRGQLDKAITSFTDFGKSMLQNQFSFQLGLQLAGPGVMLNYLVEGSDIYAYRINKASVIHGRNLSWID